VRRPRAETIVLVVALTVFVAVSFLQSGSRRAQASYPSTYDTGAHGYAALYEFLERERVQPGRYEKPAGELPKRATLVVAGDYAIEPIYSAKNSANLETWVRGGGRLIVLGAIYPGTRDALKLPRARSASDTVARGGCAFHGTVSVSADFSGAMRSACDRTSSALLLTRSGAGAVLVKHGRGTIAYVVTPTIFDNQHLLQRDNAAFAYDLFSTGAPPQFDEYVYGYGSEKSFWQVLPPAVLAAVAVALFALLLAVIGANIRLAPPRPVEREEQRDSYDYIESLARMLQRGGTARDIIARLWKAAASLRPPALGDESGQRALAELRGLHQEREPGARDVLRAGVIFFRLRKEYEW
jgi:uncharacterized protein DUF4350